jgi:small subunit ribosomal protein S15Ae
MTLKCLEEFVVIDDQRAGKIHVDLIGRLNNCGMISPRFDMQLNLSRKTMENLFSSISLCW